VDKIKEEKGWFGNYDDNRKKKWGSGLKSFVTGKLYPFSDIGKTLNMSKCHPAYLYARWCQPAGYDPPARDDTCSRSYNPS
jgi:hypothetical protein